MENKKRHQQQEGERQHPNHDIRERLAQEELEFGDGSRAKISDRTGFLLEHDSDARHDRRNQNQHHHDDARNHGEDALEALVVAEAVFQMESAEVDVGHGVGAEALDDEILRISQAQAGDVALRGFAAERDGAVDPDGDLGRMQACKIAPEAGGNFNGDCQLAAFQPLLHLRRGADRTLFGEITRA